MSNLIESLFLFSFFIKNLQLSEVCVMKDMRLKFLLMFIVLDLSQPKKYVGKPNKTKKIEVVG